LHQGGVARNVPPGVVVVRVPVKNSPDLVGDHFQRLHLVYLQSIPARVITHNFLQVLGDLRVVKELSVPGATFLQCRINAHEQPPMSKLPRPTRTSRGLKPRTRARVASSSQLVGSCRRPSS